MTTGEEERTAPPPPPPPPSPRDGLPLWLTCVVVLVLLALFSYSVVVLGTEGLPLTYFIGGLLGVYGGANELLKARDRQQRQREDRDSP